MALAGLIAAFLAAVATPAAAGDTILGHRVDRPVDAAAAIAVIGAGLGLTLIPLREDRGLWRHELLGAVDVAVHDNSSRWAARASDVLRGESVVSPVIYLTERPSRPSTMIAC